MRILLLGDYSGCHANLAEGLRKLGHEVTLVSNGCSFMQIPPDILLERKPGFAGALKYMVKVLRVMRKWRGYDVVQFINPHFLEMRPEKLHRIFRYVAAHNHKCFVTLCSEDSYFARALVNGSEFRYSEAKIGNSPTGFYRQFPEFFDNWLIPEVWNYQVDFFNRCDGLISVLPEYHIGAAEEHRHKLHTGAIPVNLAQHPFNPLKIDGKVKVFIGYKSGLMKRKGTDRLLHILRELAAELPDRMELIEAHDIPFNQYLKAMQSAHIVVDQLYAYSPATNALNAMAMGKVAATGGEQEYYDWIGETNLQPIIPLRPTDNVKEQLRRYILNPELLEAMGRDGRKLVEQHNEMTLVAQKFIDAWNAEPTY